MNFKFSLLLLVIALSTNTGDAFWGGRRRRGGSWFRRTWNKAKSFAGKVYGHYNKYKPLINYGIGLLGDNSAVFADLASLKENDRDSYDEFMKKIKDGIEQQFPEADGDIAIQAFDEIADMQPDEREQFLKHIKVDVASDEKLDQADELQNELAMRVAAAE